MRAGFHEEPEETKLKRWRITRRQRDRRQKAPVTPAPFLFN
jgi:hypothetical protein